MATTTATRVNGQAARPAGSPWSVPEAASFLNVSESHLRRLIEAGRVRAIGIGQRRLIPDRVVRTLADKGLV